MSDKPAAPSSSRKVKSADLDIRNLFAIEPLSGYSEKLGDTFEQAKNRATEYLASLEKNRAAVQARLEKLIETEKDVFIKPREVDLYEAAHRFIELIEARRLTVKDEIRQSDVTQNNTNQVVVSTWTPPDEKEINRMLSKIERIWPSYSHSFAVRGFKAKVMISAFGDHFFRADFSRFALVCGQAAARGENVVEELGQVIKMMQTEISCTPIPLKSTALRREPADDVADILKGGHCNKAHDQLLREIKELWTSYFELSTDFVLNGAKFTSTDFEHLSPLNVNALSCILKYMKDTIDA